MDRILSRAVLAMRMLNRGVEAVLNPLAAVLIAVMLATVVWTVAARLSGISAPWTEKVILILLPTLAFVTAPIAYRRAANVALDLFVDLMPTRVRAGYSVLLHLGILVLLLVGLDLTLRKVGVDPAPLTAVIKTVTGLDLSVVRPFAPRIKIPVLNIEWRTVFMVMPACLALMVLVNIELLLRHLHALIAPPDTEIRPIRPFQDASANVGE